MDWPEFFLSAIGGIARRLPLAVQGNGARENWLQTEIMLYPMEDAGRKKYPNTDIWINCQPCYGFNGRTKYDLAHYRDQSYESLDMVAEIKLLDGDYYNKNLNGKEFIEKIILFNKERYFPNESDFENNMSGNIMGDAWRLRLVPKRIDAFLMLVLFKNYENTLLYKALDKIIFVSDPERETVKDFDSFRVKIWSIER